MKYIPLYLAAALLLCLAPMPYGYFTLVRFLATVVFGVYAYKYYAAKKEGLTWVFVTLALLFQPFAKVGLGRTIWNIIDVVVAIGLVVLFFMEWKKGGKSPKDNTPIPPKDPSMLGSGADNLIEFKLEGQLIKRHPEYEQDDRLLLDKIDVEAGTVKIGDKVYPMLDTNFPTIDWNDPYKLTDVEQELIDNLRYSFKHSEKLQQHIRFLYSHGSMYKIYNNNLLFYL